MVLRQIVSTAYLYCPYMHAPAVQTPPGRMAGFHCLGKRAGPGFNGRHGGPLSTERGRDGMLLASVSCCLCTSPGWYWLQSWLASLLMIVWTSRQGKLVLRWGINGVGRSSRLKLLQTVKRVRGAPHQWTLLKQGLAFKLLWLSVSLLVKLLQELYNAER